MDMCYKDCYMYTVQSSCCERFPWSKIYHISCLVDDSKAFVAGYVIVAHIETIHIEHI